MSGCYGLFYNDKYGNNEFCYIVSDARYWAYCSECNTLGLVLFGATEKLHCCAKNRGHSLAPVDIERIVVAADKARSYRFGKIA